MGNLIAPVQVEGKWYYYWDRSGDGTSDNVGSQNAGADYVNHNLLDAIFNKDINGVTNLGSDTTDVYRYATISGIKLALPTANGGNTYPGGIGFLQPGTSAALGDTSTYDDLLAIWDTHNGPGTGTDIAGVPPGWRSDAYWSATPAVSFSGHAYVHLYTGTGTDTGDNALIYVALQVL
jgi:hypothetical protein